MIQKIFITILCALNIQNKQQCTLNTRTQFNEPLPVIIKDGRLLEPTDNYGNVHLENGDILTLSCEGQGYIVHPNSNQQLSTATISCLNGESFINSDWLNAPSSFSSFRCYDSPMHVCQRTNRTCFDGNAIYEVGYRIQDVFYQSYESCFNEATLNVLYSKYTQKPYNAFFKTRVVRPHFIANDVFEFIPVDALYSPRGLKDAVARNVGTIVDRYFRGNETLSRGHLAAKTDFVFAFGERATFHYVNCAPQWVGFNGGNWNTLEVNLRDHVHNAGYDTIVYTGTFGVTQLYDDYGKRVQLYLYNDRNNNPVIPVPQYYYKVVYEQSTKRGIAFVGINNPYYTQEEARELFFCRDLCRGNRDFHWLMWHPDNPAEGYTFCCTVDNFRETVRHLPPFKVTGLLT